MTDKNTNENKRINKICSKTKCQPEVFESRTAVIFVANITLCFLAKLATVMPFPPFFCKDINRITNVIDKIICTNYFRLYEF